MYRAKKGPRAGGDNLKLGALLTLNNFRGAMFGVPIIFSLLLVASLSIPSCLTCSRADLANFRQRIYNSLSLRGRFATFKFVEEDINVNLLQKKLGGQKITGSRLYTFQSWWKLRGINIKINCVSRNSTSR